MGNPFFHDVNPPVTPPPVTPADSPGDPAGYAGITPSDTREPAPYSISAPQDIDGLAAAVSAAGGLSGAGIVYPQGPRQRETEALLSTPQGAGEMNVLGGFPDYENNDIMPPPQTGPFQGSGPYPGTSQGGVPQYPAGAGSMEGVLFPQGSMSGSMEDDYPGTSQDGLTKYGATG